MADARASAVAICGGAEGECGNWGGVSGEGVLAMGENETMRAMVEGNPGEAMTHSEPVGDPVTTGTRSRQLISKTPENVDGEINPSAPGETGCTPHSDRRFVSAQR